MPEEVKEGSSWFVNQYHIHNSKKKEVCFCEENVDKGQQEAPSSDIGKESNKPFLFVSTLCVPRPSLL